MDHGLVVVHFEERSKWQFVGVGLCCGGDVVVLVVVEGSSFMEVLDFGTVEW